MRIGRTEWIVFLVLAGCSSGGATNGDAAGRELEKGIRAANAGDDEAAIRHYTQVIKLAPHASRAFDLRAKSHAKLGNDKQALADYGRAISVAPDVDKALHLSNRARYHSVKGRNRDAERDFTERRTAIDQRVKSSRHSRLRWMVRGAKRTNGAATAVSANVRPCRGSSAAATRARAAPASSETAMPGR